MPILTTISGSRPLLKLRRGSGGKRRRLARLDRPGDPPGLLRAGWQRSLGAALAWRRSLGETAPMQRYAIFLNGPIGAGKTTLGKALAEELRGGFIDGDDHSDPDLPWYGSILQTSRSVVRAGLKILADRPCVVIAYPLGCSTWIFYRRHFADAGVRPLFISLRASYAGITSAARGRIFDDEERERIRVMLREGYAERPFSDLVVDTDTLSFEATLHRLASDVRQLIAA